MRAVGGVPGRRRTRAFPTQKGVDLTGEQETKTKKALEYFSAAADRRRLALLTSGLRQADSPGLPTHAPRGLGRPRDKAAAALGITQQRGATDDAPDGHRRPDPIQVGGQECAAEQELGEPESDLAGGRRRRVRADAASLVLSANPPASRLRLRSSRCRGRSMIQSGPCFHHELTAQDSTATTIATIPAAGGGAPGLEPVRWPPTGAPPARRGRSRRRGTSRDYSPKLATRTAIPRASATAPRKRSEPPAHGVSAWCAAPTLNRVSQVRLLSGPLRISVRRAATHGEKRLCARSGSFYATPVPHKDAVLEP